MTEYTEAIRQHIRSMRSEPAPPPWTRVEAPLIGGLHSVGFGVHPGQEDLLLVASWSGRSVLDGLTGGIVARDGDEAVQEWTGPLGQECAGIGPLDGQWLPMTGIWGGGLPRVTIDDWSVARLVIDWPDERVVLQPPGRDVTVPGEEFGCVQLDAPMSEVRAAGFSRSSRVLAIATASELTIFARQGPVGT